ncbi:hypothetical protein PSPO01_13068 [Paraphaeosphaeria sporulosa]
MMRVAVSFAERVLPPQAYKLRRSRSADQPLRRDGTKSVSNARKHQLMGNAHWASHREGVLRLPRKRTVRQRELPRRSFLRSSCTTRLSVHCINSRSSSMSAGSAQSASRLQGLRAQHADPIAQPRSRHHIVLPFAQADRQDDICIIQGSAAAALLGRSAARVTHHPALIRHDTAPGNQLEAASA